ncbi:hypothetical protein L3Y34_008354 [Caenorhabditis briggsae]|uniref:G-protein coupled receptors family 1 profile domain-containing protein n=1 Tax=Caenorhabditis briggsae TaxID=6238 RepID=A0AAE9A909_CAEBR|nr:hypothetical protein L3Y34_008354 [Caenorhabditis briggsae]
MFLVLCLFLTWMKPNYVASDNSPIFELDSEVPPEEKDALYYIIISAFVIFTVLSTLLAGTFLVCSIIFWGNFRTMRFFWFLTQLTFSVFILSSLNLVVNVPTTLFSLLTKEFTQTVLYFVMSYIIDFCHYTILISNLVIAIQRFFVFFFRHLTYKVFDSLVIFAWLLSVWLVSGAITVIMAANNCRYNYKKTDEHYVLNCQPIKSPVDIPPPKWIRMTSSTVFLFCQTLTFNISTAFLIKRVINTIEIFAGTATPCFFFFTSKEIRKLLSTKISAIEAEVPPQQKTSLYYLVITLFVISVIACTLLTGAFLVLLILLWGQFKSIKYYWFLSQLTVSVFFLSSLNLVINVPATLFSLLTPDFVTSDIYIILSYTADYMHYSILISNLVIAIQRFSVFLFRNYSSTLFDSHFVYIWLVIVWLAPGAIIFFMAYNNCRYVFLKAKKDNFVLKCETAGSVVDLPQPEWIRFMELALQFGIPVLIFCMYVAVVFKICSMKKSALNKQETRVLVQAIIIFLLFQASSTVFLFCQTLSFNAATAFIIKKSINTLEIFAGAATPCFSFFASEKIRKMLSSKVPAISSQGSTNSAARKPTLVEVEN